VKNWVAFRRGVINRGGFGNSLSVGRAFCATVPEEGRRTLKNEGKESYGLIRVKSRRGCVGEGFRRERRKEGQLVRSEKKGNEGKGGAAA